jgi:membrane protease YdiL (CAAX protease family)
MPRLNSILTYRNFKIDFSLFILFGVLAWFINVVSQSIFPSNNLIPLLVRSAISLSILTACYYINFIFIRKNSLNTDMVKFKPESTIRYLSGIMFGSAVIATIWIVVYMFHPFAVVRNASSTTNVAVDIITYSLSNTLEELLFRGFLLLAAVKLLGEMIGILFICLLFGLFHLQGTGLTPEGLSMVITTFTMSLLLISIIFYTKSIWPAVTFHITGNLLLHTFGFDGQSNGKFQLKFASTHINGNLVTLIYEIIVIVFALLFYFKTPKNNA